MPNDAKFGLVVGVGLVIAVAVVFFRKDVPTQKAIPQEAPMARVVAPSAPQPTEAQTAGQAAGPIKPLTTETHLVSRSERQHVIAEGETLFAIAEKYYSNGDRFIDIYQVNREVLKNPDRLPVGSTIRIP